MGQAQYPGTGGGEIAIVHGEVTITATTTETVLEFDRPIIMVLIGPGSAYGGIGRIAIRGVEQCGSYYNGSSLARCVWSSDYRRLAMTGAGFSESNSTKTYIAFLE